MYIAGRLRTASSPSRTLISLAVYVSALMRQRAPLHELPTVRRSQPATDRAWSEIPAQRDRKSTRLNSSHSQISYAVFCLKKKITAQRHYRATCDQSSIECTQATRT